MRVKDQPRTRTRSRTLARTRTLTLTRTLTRTLPPTPTPNPDQAPDAIEFSPSGNEFSAQLDSTISEFVSMLKSRVGTLISNDAFRRYTQPQTPAPAPTNPAPDSDSDSDPNPNPNPNPHLYLTRYTQPVINGRQDSAEINEAQPST